LESFLYGKPGLGIFEETGAGSSDGRNLVKEVIFRNHGLVGRGDAEERGGWRSSKRWSTVYLC